MIDAMPTIVPETAEATRFVRKKGVPIDSN